MWRKAVVFYRSEHSIQVCWKEFFFVAQMFSRIPIRLMVADNINHFSHLLIAKAKSAELQFLIDVQCPTRIYQLRPASFLKVEQSVSDIVVIHIEGSLCYADVTPCYCICRHFSSCIILECAIPCKFTAFSRIHCVTGRLSLPFQQWVVRKR